MEEQADYITETIEMLGQGYEPSLEIESPRKVVERRNGKLIETERAAFVKIYTTFKQELKNLDGESLKIWLYLALSVNRKTETANPGLRNIAEETGISVNTVRDRIELLEKKGLLTIESRVGRQGNSYKPADYVSVNRNVSAGDTLGNVSISEKNVSISGGNVSVSRKKNAQLEELELTRNDDEGVLFKTYTSEIGLLTPLIANALEDWITLVPPQWVTDAIHIAAKNNARSWSYIEAILKRWKAQGNQNEVKPDRKGKQYANSQRDPQPEPVYTEDDYKVAELIKQRRLQQTVS